MLTLCEIYTACADKLLPPGLSSCCSCDLHVVEVRSLLASNTFLDGELQETCRCVTWRQEHPQSTATEGKSQPISFFQTSSQQLSGIVTRGTIYST